MGEVVKLPREVREIAHELERYLELRGPAPADHTAPTPERLKKPDMDGKTLRVKASVDDAGTVTTWRISPILDELKRRKTITGQEYAAAQRFLRDYFLGMYAGPRAQAYAERTSAGSGDAELDRQTRRVHHAREAQKAMASIDRLFQPALAWMIASLGEGMPLAALGSYYARDLGTQTQSARGGQALALCCTLLCRHYGMDHPLDVEKKIAGLSQVLMQVKEG